MKHIITAILLAATVSAASGQTNGESQVQLSLVEIHRACVDIGLAVLNAARSREACARFDANEEVGKFDGLVLTNLLAMYRAGLRDAGESEVLAQMILRTSTQTCERVHCDTQLPMPMQWYWGTNKVESVPSINVTNNANVEKEN